MSWLARTTGAGANSGSEASLADDCSTVRYKFDGTELVSVSASTVRAGDMWHGDARIIAEASRGELNTDSNDATLWTSSGAINATDTGIDWGDLNKISLASGGGTSFNKRQDISLTNTETYICVNFWSYGTSGNVRFFNSSATSGALDIKGTTVGSLAITGAGTQPLTILEDREFVTGINILVYSVTAVSTESYRFGIGPNTGVSAFDVFCYGQNVFLADYRPTWVTSGGSPTTYNADALHYANGGWMAGKDFVFVDQYRSDCIPADLVETLLDLDNGTTKLIANATNFEFTDGTNTATVAHSGIYAADTKVDVMVVRIGTSMAIGIAPAGGSVTWSTTQTYAEPTYHSKLWIAPTQVAPHYIGLTGIYDADEFATIGDAKTWVEGQVTAGWPAPAGDDIIDGRFGLGIGIGL